jgi:hypothetical protein
MKLFNRGWFSYFQKTTPLLLGGELDAPHILAEDGQALKEPIPLSEWMKLDHLHRQWDLQLTLSLHTVLCVQPMPGLKKEEYPLYWQSLLQKAFPEIKWHSQAVHAYSALHQPHLLSALAQTLWRQLEPLLPSCQWVRPSWSVALDKMSPSPKVVSIYIYWEKEHMLWLEYHPTIGWKQARLRRLPLNGASSTSAADAQLERARWLEQHLHRYLSPETPAHIVLYGCAPSAKALQKLPDTWKVYSETAFL